MDPVVSVDFGERCLITPVLGQSQLALVKLNAELAFESLGEVALDESELRTPAEQVLEIGDAFARRGDRFIGQLLGRDAQHAQHLPNVKVDQQRALIQQRVAVERAAGAGDFLAIDLDIVARTVARIDAERADRGRRGMTDALGNRLHVRSAELALVQIQLPAELRFIEINRAAAGDTALDRDVVRLAIVEIELLLGTLVIAEQRARRKAQKPQSTRAFLGLARLEPALRRTALALWAVPVAA